MCDESDKEVLFLCTSDYLERERMGLVKALRRRDVIVSCLDRFFRDVRDIYKNVDNEVPDFILHPDMHRVYLPEGIEKLDCATACLHIDSYSGVENRSNMSRLFDLSLICHPDYLSRYSNIHPNVKSFPHAIPESRYEELSSRSEYDVVTIGRLDGSDYKYRRSAVQMLDAMNVHTNDMSRYYPYQEMVQTYSASKMTVNVSRGTYLNEAHLSCLEIMGAGTLLLTTQSGESDQPHELEMLGYDRGKHFETFENLEELRQQINFYLKHEDRRKKMASQAREETLSNHTYDQRAEKLIQWIQEGIPRKAPARKMNEGEAASIYVDYLSKRGQIDDTLYHLRRQRKDGGGSLIQSVGKAAKVTVRGWQKALFS